MPIRPNALVDCGQDVEGLERPLALDVDETPVLAPEAPGHVQEQLCLRAHLDLVTFGSDE